MATKVYPPVSEFPMASLKSAAFQADPHYEYPVDTTAGSFNITPGGTGSGAVLGSATVGVVGLTTGVVTAIAAPAVGAGGSGYTQYAPIVLNNADPGTGFIGYATVDALGAVTGVNIVAGGSGYVAPTFVVLPGPKVGDRFVISDAKAMFAVNSPIVKTGYWKLWGVQGDDLSLVEAGMSACLVFTAANGWMMSAGS